tara:strand:+ start:1849 stop:2538 length:690 start_codon:yes stop_codon:yes gene_type:complete
MIKKCFSICFCLLFSFPLFSSDETPLHSLFEDLREIEVNTPRQTKDTVLACFSEFYEKTEPGLDGQPVYICLGLRGHPLGQDFDDRSVKPKLFLLALLHEIDPKKEESGREKPTTYRRLFLRNGAFSEDIVTDKQVNRTQFKSPDKKFELPVFTSCNATIYIMSRQKLFREGPTPEEYDPETYLAYLKALEPGQTKDDEWILPDLSPRSKQKASPPKTSLGWSPEEEPL